MFVSDLVGNAIGKTIMKQITMVRIYLTEAEGRLNKLLKYLHDESKVSGVTVLRGISGFGQSGKIHATHLVDLSLDLPVIIEFFDSPEKITQILSHLKTLVKPNHIVYWQAQCH
jgi:PII-like signaling protein